MTRLILITPEFGAQSCELPNGILRVGRAPHNDIVLRDESVSAEHCELLVQGVEVIVRELGSRNGTYVNDVRVAAQSGVTRGQTLRIGRVEARLDHPEMTEDSSTDNTAVFAYRKAVVTEESRGAPPAKLPVIFEPGLPSVRGTGTMILPRPVAAPEIPKAMVLSESPAHRATGRSAWVIPLMLVAGGLVAVLIVWFLR